MAKKSKNRGGGIKSVRLSTGRGERRVQLGSKAYERYIGQGATAISGTGKNLTKRDIGGVRSQFKDFDDEISTTTAKREAMAEGKTLPYQDFEANLGQTGQVSQPEAIPSPIPSQNLQTPPSTPDSFGTTPLANRVRGVIRSSQDSVNRFKQGFQASQTGNIPTPMDSPAGRQMVQQYTPPAPQMTPADQIFQPEEMGGDPFFTELMAGFEEYFNPKKQKESLTKEYQRLLKQSGVQQLDTEIMNARNVIEGTEDDIRTEVAKVNGFATDSQVMALAAARNKTLIKNYNNLLELRDQKQQHLDTMLQLSQQDRQAADQRFERMFSMGMQMMQYRDKAIDNARAGYQSVINKRGEAGLLAMTGGDPEAIRRIERAMGYEPGGLERLASLPPSEEDQLDLDYKRAQLRNINLEIRKREMEMNPTETSQLYAGLTPQTATAVRGIVGGYKSEPQITNFAAIKDGYLFSQSLSDTTENPADDQALIYALAKALDPGSVVREGEYNTAQKYAQSWAKAYGKKVEQAIAGTGFLSEEARRNIKKTIETKYWTSKRSYMDTYNEYVRQINELTGRDDAERFLRNYGRIFAPNPEGGEEIEIIEKP